ncbi:MAG: 4-hydroxybenzoate octaprenyltransferase [Phycisphaerae bacterium]|nr:4-hydroxybenzoate octaprenyltransferase [Phycisphaerae bacterium]
MVKVAHSVFAMPFALLAMFLAARPNLPTLTQFVLIVICMVAARSAAMTFNRICDARIDAANPRTSNRPLPTGRLSSRHAWAFFICSVLVFELACLVFWLEIHNPWPTILSLPVLALLCVYSYTKRFTRWSHVVLGLAIGSSPVAAWIAINPGTLDLPAWLLMVAVVFWIGGFDLIYACQDVDFDRRTGLLSVPSVMGVDAALNLARLFHLLTVAALVGVGVTASLGLIYFVAVLLVTILLIVENALVSARDLSRVNLAFFTVNGVVSMLFGTLGIIDVLV